MRPILLRCEPVHPHPSHFTRAAFDPTTVVLVASSALVSMTSST